MFNGMFKLPYVSRPVIPSQQDFHLFRDTVNLSVKPFVEELPEMIRQ
jgi:hypothetical protein